MLRHEDLRKNPLGVARRVWDDTAWRAAIITAALIFLLELVIWAVSVEPGIGWVASIVALLAIGRALTMSGRCGGWRVARAQLQSSKGAA